MREIKFKVYDPEQGRAITLEEAWKLGVIKIWSEHLEAKEGLKLKLNTTLKDKENNDIYEGDEVLIRYLDRGGNPNDQVHTVKWNGNGYGNVFDDSFYTIIKREKDIK